MPLRGFKPAEGRGRRVTHGKGSESGLPRAKETCLLSRSCFWKPLSASRLCLLTATYPAVRSCPFSAETGGTGGPCRKQWLRHRTGGGDAGPEPRAAMWQTGGQVLTGGWEDRGWLPAWGSGRFKTKAARITGRACTVGRAYFEEEEEGAVLELGVKPFVWRDARVTVGAQNKCAQPSQHSEPACSSFAVPK